MNLIQLIENEVINAIDECGNNSSNENISNYMNWDRIDQYVTDYVWAIVEEYKQKEKCFILENIDKSMVNNYPIILDDYSELIEFLENYTGKYKYLISYSNPKKGGIYYNLNGDLIKGDFTPIECEV